jgi:hypothetical protein
MASRRPRQLMTSRRPRQLMTSRRPRQLMASRRPRQLSGQTTTADPRVRLDPVSVGSSQGQNERRAGKSVRVRVSAEGTHGGGATANTRAARSLGPPRLCSIVNSALVRYLVWRPWGPCGGMSFSIGHAPHAACMRQNRMKLTTTSSPSSPSATTAGQSAIDQDACRGAGDGARDWGYYSSTPRMSTTPTRTIVTDW